MATKEHQKDLKKRIQLLINEAGGRTEFIRRVWPDSDPVLHKGKVAKWATGKTGIRSDAAQEVARAFESRPEWVLYGDEPRRPDASRPVPTLAEEVRNEVLRRALAGESLDQWREVLEQWADGERMLDRLAEMVRADAHLLVARWERMESLHGAIQRVRGEPGWQRQAKHLLELFNGVFRGLEMRVLREPAEWNTDPRTGGNN